MMRLFSYLLYLLGCLALAGLSFASEKDDPRVFEVEVHKDVAYYEGAGADPVKHKLDLFLPKGHKDYPILLFVHGGGWQRGDKSYLGVYSKIGTFLARHGIGTVVINYRLSPGVQHPEHIKDVARAFAWTHKNLPRYGGKADQLFIMGHSAGGHLVALLATDESYLKAEGLTSRAIRGVIPISGVYNIPERMLASVFGKEAEKHTEASPIRKVRPNLPPFLVLYADKDFPGCGKVPSDAFAKAIREKGNKAATQEITESNHYQIILGAALADSAVSKAILKFIGEQVGKPMSATTDEPIPPPRHEPEADELPAIQEKLDIPYHEGSSLQTLDVFSPVNCKKSPVVLFVHGGGWITGDKNLFGLYRSVGRFFAEQGFVAVLINYRLSPGVKHPEHVRDLAQAFAWTRKHISVFGGDPDQIVLGGHSAGGHLVSLLATDPKYLGDPALKLQDCDRQAIRAVISISGVYRIPDGDEFVEMLGEMASSLASRGGGLALASAALMPALIKSGKEINPFRMVFGDNDDVRVNASPINHVHKGLPPFLLLHGQRDLPGLRQMARDFRDALEKKEVPVELKPIQGHNHNTIVFRLQRPNDPTARAILDFLIQLQLKKP